MAPSIHSLKTVVLTAATFACIASPNLTAAPQQTIIVRSGQVNGAPGPQPPPMASALTDDTFSCVNVSGSNPISGSPIDSAQCQAAITGSAARMIIPRSNWLASLSEDSEARWVNFGQTTQSFGTQGSALYGGEFTSPFSGPAILRFSWAADERLGDPSGGTNVEGVYVNGVALDISGGGFSFESTVESEIDLVAGTNTLCVYQRETGCCFSGIIFSASFTEKNFTIRSGQVDGIPGTAPPAATGQFDDSFRSIWVTGANPISASPLTVADCQDAIVGDQAPLVKPRGNWLQSLPSDSDARWIGFALNSNDNGLQGSALYGTTFTPAYAGPANLTFSWAVDEQLGDPGAGPNPSGVYLNGTPLNISGGSFTSETSVTVPVQLLAGPNMLCIYQRETVICCSGIMFSARFECSKGMDAFNELCFGDGVDF